MWKLYGCQDASFFKRSLSEVGKEQGAQSVGVHLFRLEWHTNIHKPNQALTFLLSLRWLPLLPSNVLCCGAEDIRAKVAPIRTHSCKNSECFDKQIDSLRLYSCKSVCVFNSDVEHFHVVAIWLDAGRVACQTAGPKRGPKEARPQWQSHFTAKTITHSCNVKWYNFSIGAGYER